MALDADYGRIDERDPEKYAIMHFYDGSTRAALDMLAKKAEEGGAADQFAFGMKMLDLINPYMAPDDVPVYRDALALFEAAGRQGHVEAMEYAVRLHASGLPHQKIVESGNTITATDQPDWDKAYEWCVKARDAGGAWATKIFAQLCADKAEAEREKNPRASGPSPSAPS